MRLRELFRLDEKAIQINVDQVHDFPVAVNPTRRRMEQWITTTKEQILRALPHEGNLYVWDAYYAIHDQIIMKLGLPAITPKITISHVDDPNVNLSRYTTQSRLNWISGELACASTRWKNELPPVVMKLLPENPAVDLTEAKMETIGLGPGSEISVWFEPQWSEILTLTRKFGALRGFIYRGGGLIMWNAHDSSHQSMRDKIPESRKYSRDMMSPVGLFMSVNSEVPDWTTYENHVLGKFEDFTLWGNELAIGFSILAVKKMKSAFRGLKLFPYH
jgi:hypothetical protein